MWGPPMPNTAILPPTPIYPGCKLEAGSAEHRCCGSGVIVGDGGGNGPHEGLVFVVSACRSSTTSREAFWCLAEYCPGNVAGFDRSAAIHPNVELYAFGLGDLTQRHHPESRG